MTEHLTTRVCKSTLWLVEVLQMKFCQGLPHLFMKYNGHATRPIRAKHY